VSYVGIILTLALAENVVLSQLLGICPCIGAPRRQGSAVGIGLSAVLLMSASALGAWLVRTQVLVPLGLQFFQTFVFVSLTFFLGWLADTVLAAAAPALLRAAGFSLQSLGINCAVLGIALIVVRARYGPLESLVAGAAAGAGFLVALVLMSAIRDRLDSERVPRPLRGAPIALISAGLISIAFLAFDAAVIRRLVG
jgi:Na+-translocating ferredoxin:NAD+ oxidoreductase subunit A